MSRSRPTAYGERAALEVLLRRAVKERADAISCRRAAREIGVRPQGLAHFLGGKSPREAALEKIREWHDTNVGHGEMSPLKACAALYLLVDHLSIDEREPTIRLILAVIAYLHQRRGSQGAPWLAPLCEHFGVVDE